MFRYTHTNLIVHDLEGMLDFYETVLHCRRIGQKRDHSAPWIAAMTGVAGAHIVGEHLLLPGWGDNLPTLEVFTYKQALEILPHEINRPGFAHLSFEVDDVAETLALAIAHGGSQLGELVKAPYPNGKEATFVYLRDPEGNILELQSWRNTNG